MRTTATLILLVALAGPAPAQSERVASLLARAEQATGAGAHDRALGYLKLAYRLEPDRAELPRRIAEALLHVGVRFANEEAWTRARDAFREGTRWQPRDGRHWLGLGQTAVRLGDGRAAESALAKAVELRPGSYSARLALGKLHYDERRYAAARPHLAAADRLRPGQPWLRKLLAKAAADAAVEHSFADVRSGRFVIRFNGERRGLEKHVPAIEGFLRRTWDELARLLDVQPRRIVVVLYTNTEFRRLVRTADWVRAFYDGKVRVPLNSWVTQKGRVQRTIRHELCHAFLYAVEPRLSSWIQEGFAQSTDGSRVDLARDTFRSRAMLAAAPLRRPFASESDPNAARLLYAQALVLFRHLDEKEGIAGFRRFVYEVGNATGPAAEREATALRKVYGATLAELIREVAAKHDLGAPGR